MMIIAVRILDFAAAVKPAACAIIAAIKRAVLIQTVKYASLAGFVGRCIAILLLGAVQANAQVYQGRQLVKATLLADTSAVVPGKPFTIGLLLQMAPDWHTYWKY